MKRELKMLKTEELLEVGWTELEMPYPMANEEYLEK